MFCSTKYLSVLLVLYLGVSTCLKFALGRGNNTEAISQGRGGMRTKVGPLQCNRTDWSHAKSRGDNQRYPYLDICNRCCVLCGGDVEGNVDDFLL
jgi:hypothetical protein